MRLKRAGVAAMACKPDLGLMIFVNSYNPYVICSHLSIANK